MTKKEREREMRQSMKRNERIFERMEAKAGNKIVSKEVMDREKVGTRESHKQNHGGMLLLLLGFEF